MRMFDSRPKRCRAFTQWGLRCRLQVASRAGFCPRHRGRLWLL